MIRKCKFVSANDPNVIFKNTIIRPSNIIHMMEQTISLDLSWKLQFSLSVFKVGFLRGYFEQLKLKFDFQNSKS